MLERAGRRALAWSGRYPRGAVVVVLALAAWLAVFGLFNLFRLVFVALLA
ncbi:hypothetical protein SAMN05216456_0544 [Devosia crocina]|uniref:Uncharacterized protein n=2 Tax=Devosia crocina TaxID=429728 RepID=A0A1I7N1X1_9HYPH|nr:hypothetical protein SAMN05216456_0544 [Devosia crocina]